MSLDKAIEHHKEKRKKFYGAKAVDSECRNHGKCQWCKMNRAYKNKIEEERTKDFLKEELEELK